MNPDISEFSYGYNLTESFIWDTGLPVVGAPIFPSLIEEGRKGGHDVAIPFKGLLLFLQFKLSHYMKRATAYESSLGLINVPFYRMHLRPVRHSRQHVMLLELEAGGEVVFYAAPKFHLPSELNDAYLNRAMVQRSFFIRPSEIGPLPDELYHYVSFRDGYPVYLCSEPIKIRDKESSETAIQVLHDIITHRGYKKYDNDVLSEIADRMLGIILRHQISLRRGDISPEHNQRLENIEPIEKLRYLSRTYFGCEPILVKPRIFEE